MCDHFLPLLQEFSWLTFFIGHQAHWEMGRLSPGSSGVGSLSPDTEVHQSYYITVSSKKYLFGFWWVLTGGQKSFYFYIFFQVVAVSVLLYDCTTWTLTKCQRKSWMERCYMMFWENPGSDITSHLTPIFWKFSKKDEEDMLGTAREVRMNS